MSRFRMPMSLASERPAMSASYSASLFVALKPHLIANWMMSPYGEIRTSPRPSPPMLLEPSTESNQFGVGLSMMASHSLLACA